MEFAATAGLSIAAFVVALLALAVSALVAGLRVWELFLARPKWDLTVDWIEHQGAPILRFTIANIGARKFGVREIRFGKAETPSAQGWFPKAAVLDRLPLLLEPGEISSAFYVQTVPGSSDAFDIALAEQQIAWCVIVDAVGRETFKPIAKRATG